MKENGGDEPKIIEFRKPEPKPEEKKQVPNKELSEAKINAAGMFSEAQDLEKNGQKSEALELYKQAFKMDPELWEAGVNSAAILIQDKKYSAAIIVLRQAYYASPEQPLIHQDLAVAYEGQKEYDRAAEHYKQALQFDPNNSDVIYAYAELLFKQRKSAEALEQFKKYKELKSDRDEYYKNALKRIEQLSKSAIKRSGLKIERKKP